MIALALLRFLARTPWSTSMALLGMALGVASIVSVHLVSATVSSRLDGLVPNTLATYNHYLHRDQLDTADYFALRRLWRAGAYPDVAQLSPLVDETTVIDGFNVRVLGTDLLANPPSSTRNSTAANDTSSEFSWSGVWVDETLTNIVSLPINGVIEAPQGTLLADIATAHDLLDWSPNQLSYVGLERRDAFSNVKQTAEKLLPGFGAGFPSAEPTLDLPDGWQLVSTAEQYPAREFGKSILFNISALAMLALLVAWLLIYQVAVSWLRRFWPVFDRLHVLGVEWQQLRLYFLFSIGLLATVAALVGLFAGWWLATWLLAVAVPGEATDLSLDGWVVFKAIGSSVSICLIGGTWAFQQSKLGSKQSSLPIMITLGLLLAALWCVFQPESGLAGGFFAIAVLSLVASQVIAPLIKRFKHWATLIKGSYLLRIGVREAVWHPNELSVAISGLALAIATSIGVALMVDSFRSDFSQMLDHRLTYDLIIEGDAKVLESVLESVSDEAHQVMNTIVQAQRTQAYRQTNLRLNGRLTSLNVTQVDTFEAKRYRFDRQLADQEILLSEQASQTLNLNIDDTFEYGNETLTVVGIFSAFGDLQPRVVVNPNNPLAKTNSSQLTLTSIAMISNEPQVLISKLRENFPTLEIRLQSEIRKVALDTFDQTFAITTVLITIALLVATISVYIAVTTMRLNRRTGRQLLTTLGTTRAEQLTMNIALGSGLGLIAITIALPLGIMFGWILCNVINPRAFGWTIDLELSANALLYSCAWGMLAAIVAGVLQSGGKEEGAFGER